MIAIHVRAKGNAAITHLAKPVELSVESEVLQDAEERHHEAKTHPEPDKSTPVLERAESLGGKKENERVGKEETTDPCACCRTKRCDERPIAQERVVIAKRAVVTREKR